MSSQQTTRKLPGDGAATIDQILRVNQAGEYGAQRIYAGQLAVLKGKPCESEIRHMAEQETVHLETFNEMLPRYGARPTALLPFWHAAGYALGAGTALMGERAAMACTVAVESVITEHYNQQLETLPDSEKELKSTIAQFRDEEQEHHDIGIANEAEQALAYPLLSGVIRGGCKLAIRLAEKF